jgi:hypothetical protein
MDLVKSVFWGFVFGFGEIYLLDCIGFVIISKLSESLFVRWFYKFLFLNPGFAMKSHKCYSNFIHEVYFLIEAN